MVVAKCNCEVCRSCKKRAVARAKYAADPERFRAAAKLKYQKNKSKILAREKAKRAEDPEKTRAKWREQERRRDPKRRLQTYRKRNGIIDAHRFEQVFERQNHCCAICTKPLAELGNQTNADHCHETGRLRGVLCTNCNIGIGNLKDNPELCFKAAEYLKNPPAFVGAY